MTTLRPMTEAEYKPYLSMMLEDYAQVRARNLNTSLEQEMEESRKQIGELLPNGIRSEGHRIWTVVDDAGEGVGTLWVFINEAQKDAFIYEIHIDEEQRGKGYGKRTLELLEEELRPLGIKSISLNVFGDNAVAQRLYQKQGYGITSMHMKKMI